MSDNFRITIYVELYGQHSMATDERGDLIVSILRDAVKLRLKNSLDFPEEAFFVSASGC
jgi:hypothetical protein